MKGRIMKHDNIDDAIVNAVYVLTWGASAKSRSQPVSSNRREKRARKAGEAARKAALARGLDEGTIYNQLYKGARQGSFHPFLSGLGL